MFVKRPVPATMASWNLMQRQTVNDNLRTSCICAHLVCGHPDACCEEGKPDTTELRHPKRGRLDPRLSAQPVEHQFGGLVGAHLLARPANQERRNQFPPTVGAHTWNPASSWPIWVLIMSATGRDEYADVAQAPACHVERHIATHGFWWH